MERLSRIRTRKPLTDCSYGYRAQINRLRYIARLEVLHSKSKEVQTEKVATRENSIEENCSLVDVFNCSEFSFNDDSSKSNGDSICSQSICSSEGAYSLANDSIIDSYDSDIVVVSDNDDVDNVETLEVRLASVFSETNVTHHQAERVLKVLKSHICFSEIHVDPRSILRTPQQSIPIVQIAEGEYLHFGFDKALLRILQSTSSVDIPDTLYVDFSTDEASLDKKSKIIMWPIQVTIVNVAKTSPEIVGIFKGSKKPTSAVEFFNPFVLDVLHTLREGIHFNGRVLSVVLRCFIADAPARAFILGHSGHNSEVPCSRCWVRGQYIRAGVMTYPDIDFPLRTCEEYKMKIDVEHHKAAESPIDLLPIDPVKQTVFDYMHLACIGVMEKILQATIDGKYAQTAKLTSAQVKLLSNRLQQVKAYCPSDFSRKPDDIVKHGKFKATELRQILLYSGPAIFYGLFNSAAYMHFLLFHTAMRIFVDYFDKPEFIDFAENCLKTFVNRAVEVYGIEFVSYNIHTLLHVADDVRSFGCLDSFSAFTFENNMTYFRKLCKKPHQHLQQIAKRRAENYQVNVAKQFENSIKFIGKHIKGPSPPRDLLRNYEQYQTLVKGSCRISIFQDNNTVILSDGLICVVENIIKSSNGHCFLVVRNFTQKNDFFSIPGCSSSITIGMFLCSSLSERYTLIEFDKIKTKCFRMLHWPQLPTADSNPETFVVATLSLSHLHC